MRMLHTTLLAELEREAEHLQLSERTATPNLLAPHALDMGMLSTAFEAGHLLNTPDRCLHELCLSPTPGESKGDNALHAEKKVLAAAMEHRRRDRARL